MARLTETREIGGLKYSVTQLGALEGRKVLARLLKVIGGLAVGKGQFRVDGLKDEDLEFLCDKFAPSTSVSMGDGKNPQLSNIFDAHFAGEYTALLEWLAFCVEVNFKTFFLDLRSGALSRVVTGLS